VNRVGEGGGLAYRGDTTLLDPMGEALAEDSEKEALVSGDVDPARVAEVRKQFSFLADTREEIYQAIASKKS
jgi:predicted amidohydrolase